MHVSHFVEGENPVDDRFERACLQPFARFDGLFVLGTNTKLAALRVPLRYRNLLAEKQAPARNITAPRSDA